VGSQWVANGDVPLHRERGDREHGGGGRQLGEEGLQQAVGLAEPPRIGFPHGVQLRRQPCNKTARQSTYRICKSFKRSLKGINFSEFLNCY